MDDENIIWNREKKAGKEWIVHTILVKEDYTKMTFFESLGVAAICIVIVFIVLCVICLFIMLFSSILSSLIRKARKNRKKKAV
ncbi:MAG: OadG family transporter subunit [Clostridia bacterium]